MFILYTINLRVFTNPGMMRGYHSNNLALAWPLVLYFRQNFLAFIRVLENVRDLLFVVRKHTR